MRDAVFMIVGLAMGFLGGMAAGWRCDRPRWYR